MQRSGLCRNTVRRERQAGLVKSRWKPHTVDPDRVHRGALAFGLAWFAIGVALMVCLPWIVGRLPGVLPQVPNRFPVKLKVTDQDADLFLAAGAAGAGAIYTEHGAMIHVVRKVIVRVGSITDYLVLKLH